MAIKTVKATINGTEYTLAYNSATGAYEKSITAPVTSSYHQDGHYYPVRVTAADDAGNTVSKDDTDSALGDELRLVVRETTAPVIQIVSPTTGATLTNNRPAITWTVTDDDSGVASSDISIDGAAAVTVTGTAITGGYQYSYTPASALADGSHTITIQAEDHDGNAAPAAAVSIKVDTAPPTLNLSAPAAGLVTNAAECAVSGVTNDVTSSPVSLTVNGAAVTVGSDGTFAASVTLSEGDNTITVTAMDAAGKSTTVTRTVTLDTTPPVIGAVSVSPNPVSGGATYTISVTVTDA